MKRKTVIIISVLLITAIVCSCQQSKSLSSDEMACKRLAKVLKVKPQKKAKVTHKPVITKYPFKVYTWRPIIRDGKAVQIEIIGKKLHKAHTLKIGDTTISLDPSKDGNRTVGSYPEIVKDGYPIVLTVDNIEYQIPERFSSLKIKGLPTIKTINFSWQMVRAPGRIPDVGGREVKAMRFDIQVSGYKQRNAPVTVFFGEVAIPNSQIADSPELLRGLIYRPDRLENGTVISVDFGHGLRVLAPVKYQKPAEDS
jgi:hypothetical protein